MNLNKFKFSLNKKIAFGSISILAAMAMLGGSAYATFTTNAIATANTFITTTPGLTIQVNGLTAGQTEPGATVTGLIPGTSGPAQAFVLTNTDTDSTAAMSINLQLTAAITNTLPGSDLTIEVICPTNSIDVKQLYSVWISSGGSLGNLAPNTALDCTMTPTLNSGVGNADIGLKAIFDATFTGSAGS